MIEFPQTAQEASERARPGTELRAGGTDHMERLELGLAPEHIVDLRDTAGLSELSGARIGARVTVAQIAADPGLRRSYPALALAAGALATPEIRSAATLGGALLQRSRCWYYRHPTLRCLKSGGPSCLARTGDHLYHACFDLGPCTAPHPSTLGMALLGYDAMIQVTGGRDRAIADLYGNGTSVADHQLGPGEVLTEVRLPEPTPGERGGYHRAISRARAEWPLVEVSTRLVLQGDRIELARVTVGGVAPVPLRLQEVERALLGSLAHDEALWQAASRSTERCNPLPMTQYKVSMLPYAVFDALRSARES
jgi:xanthine dehydrogenase YagS FAD-binding subunit